MPALATADDLAARNITMPADADVTAILSDVSDAIRDAAGCAITQLTSTVPLPAGLDRSDALKLPAGPVQSVSAVSINSRALVAGVNYVKVGDTLYRIDGYVWADESVDANYWNPCEVSVTYTHGYPTVPGDIVDLCCSLAAVAFRQIEDDTYGIGNRIQAENLGDYGVTYQRNVRGAPGAVESPSPVALPDATRAWLRARFMGSAFLVGTR